MSGNQLVRGNMIGMEDVKLDSIARFIQERSRLCFTGAKRMLLKQRIEARMASRGVTALADYRNLLHSSPREAAALFEALTVNETFFFRNPAQFRYLTERIIPGLEAERGEQVVRSWGRSEPVAPANVMKLRILCAGCSTGEEPYSVAMALLEALRYPRAWDIEIMAGDLSERCIKTAVAGYYEDERLRGLPADYLQKYLERTAGGAVINGEVKRLVRFCPLNLGRIIDGEGFPGVEVGSGSFDIIFCRNVMIYFSAETQQQLVDALYRSLAPGGYLFTGDAEALHIYDHDFQAVNDAGCLIYKRMEMP